MVNFSSWVPSLTADTLDGTEVVPIVDGATNKKITTQALADLALRFAVVVADTTGATDAASAFTTADALSAEKYVPAGTYKISSTITLAGKYWFQKGAVLKPDANVVVVFSGQIIDAGTSQLFDVTNAGARVQLDGFGVFARPEWWGCKGDWQSVSDAAITSGSAILTSVTGRFSAADVGKNIGVTGAQTDGSGHFNLTLTTTIASYQSATQVTLTANATTTVSGTTAQWWTNDQAAMQQCINGIAGATHKHLDLSATYVCHQSGANSWAIDLSKRSIGDGVCTSASPNISSATAHFTKADEGCYVGGATQIPNGAKILRVTSPTTAVMDMNATASSTARTFVVPLANLTMTAVKGQGYFKHPTGMPNASVAVVRANGNQNLTLLGVGFDGNWGNFVGNTQTGPPGINHVYQTDPKNYGLMLRGVQKVIVDYCDFTQVYGDMIWHGQLAEARTWPDGENDRALDVRIDHCTGDMSGRDGVTYGGMCERSTVHASTFTNIHTQPIDMEPQGTYQYVRDVTIDNCKFSGWFDKSLLTTNDAVSIEGGIQTIPGYTHQARGIRVTNCDLSGGIIIFDARDITIAHNRIIKDWSTTDTSAVRVQGNADNVVIDGNYIYSATPGAAGSAAVDILAYAASNSEIKPANVTCINNTILARNGRIGVKIVGTGQPSAWSAATAYVAGAVVRNVNVTYIAIASGTNNTPASSPTFWSVWDERTGDGSGGMVVVDNNLIDCFNDGAGAGAHGVYLDANAMGPNLRARVSRNRVRDATGNGVHVKTTGASSPYLFLQITDTFAWDDQAIPTAAYAVNLEAPVRVNDLRMDGNVASTGLTGTIGGIASGYWQSAGDRVPTYVGFGTPESQVAAPIGSLYQRIDGSTDTADYRKETGTGTTGWIALSQTAAGSEGRKTALQGSDLTDPNNAASYTFAADLDLAVNANDIWLVDYDIHYDGPAAGDLKFQVVGPAAATFNGSAIAPNTAAASNSSVQVTMFGGIVATTDVSVGAVAVATKCVLRISGAWRIGGTGGTCRFKFTQTAAQATRTTVFTDSRLDARRISP